MYTFTLSTVNQSQLWIQGLPEMRCGGVGVGDGPGAGNSVPLRPHLPGVCFHQVCAGGPKRALALYYRRAENGAEKS